MFDKQKMKEFMETMNEEFKEKRKERTEYVNRVHEHFCEGEMEKMDRLFETTQRVTASATVIYIITLSNVDGYIHINWDISKNGTVGLYDFIQFKLGSYITNMTVETLSGVVPTPCPWDSGYEARYYAFDPHDGYKLIVETIIT